MNGGGETELVSPMQKENGKLMLGVVGSVVYKSDMER